MSNQHHDHIIEIFHQFLESCNRSGITIETIYQNINFEVDFGDLYLFDADESRKNLIDRKIKKSIPAHKKVEQIKRWIKEDKEFAQMCEIEKAKDWELSRGL